LPHLLGVQLITQVLAEAVVQQELAVQLVMAVLQEKQQATETTASITVLAVAVVMVQVQAVVARLASFT
jgi:hypothetical protein